MSRKPFPLQALLNSLVFYFVLILDNDLASGRILQKTCRSSDVWNILRAALLSHLSAVFVAAADLFLLPLQYECTCQQKELFSVAEKIICNNLQTEGWKNVNIEDLIWVTWDMGILTKTAVMGKEGGWWGFIAYQHL